MESDTRKREGVSYAFESRPEIGETLLERPLGCLKGVESVEHLRRIGQRHGLRPAIEEVDEQVDGVAHVEDLVTVDVAVLPGGEGAIVSGQGDKLLGDNAQERCIENQREYDDTFHGFFLDQYLMM